MLLFVPINLLCPTESRLLAVLTMERGASGHLNIKLRRGEMNIPVRRCPAVKHIAIGGDAATNNCDKGVWREVSLQFHAYRPPTSKVVCGGESFAWLKRSSTIHTSLNTIVDR